MQQEDDLSIAGDDSMADQADESDSDDDEDNALEQKDHDEDDNQLSVQGKTTWPLYHNNKQFLLYRSEKMLLCATFGVPQTRYLHKL